MESSSSWKALVAALQPKRGSRGFAASIDEARVAAALMLAQDANLSAMVACTRCQVPTHTRSITS